MGGPSYSVEQLTALRESPLVKKPDGLPSILQWMDVPPEQTSNTSNSHTTTNNNTVRRTRGVRDGDAAAPLINNPMGQFGRRASTQPEDTVLGPPKLSFTSASRATKATGETKERTGVTSIDGDHLGDRFPRERGERWSRDRDADRNRDKGFANGRRGTRDDGDGWTNVKGRKSLGQEDFDRGLGRNGDRNREKHDGEADNAEAPRRGGRERGMERWGRRDDAREGEGNRFGGAGQGGWRDRERDRDRDRDRDREWNRGGNRVEEDPEWMDAKVEKKELKPRTQEDFQRWKEQMKAKDTPAEEKGEAKPEAPVEATATLSGLPPTKTAPVQTSSGADTTQGMMFGNWGKDKATDANPAETVSVKSKPDKKSRFMTMFAKPDEPAAPSQPPMAVPSSPAPIPDSNADKEGFQRILQMLGGASISTGQGPPPGAPMQLNGGRHSGGIPLDFHQQSPPPPPPEQHDNRPPLRSIEPQNMLETILAPRPSGPESRPSQQARFNNSMSPDNALLEQFRVPRPDSHRPGEDFPLQQPPSRNNNPQDANLAAILNTRAREEANRDRETKQRERDFLLTLMQQPSRGTPPQMLNQNLPRPPPEGQNMPFFDQARQPPPGPPKGRGMPPPGFMEDPRMFPDNEMMRREAERREQEFRHLTMQQQQQESMRAKNPRVPMGFPGHDDPAMNLQRRNTAGEIPRQLTNMGIPSQQMPDMPFMGGRGQPGMPPTPVDRPNIAPPPGFGGPMRQPPGLAGPNPGPPQQMGPGGPSFSAGNTPLGHPPGFPPPGNMRGMGFPGGPGGPVGPGGPGNGMQGPPQGYFPPPGYGPPMGNMPRDDPRMMFDGQFGGPGPRQQQGRPGPPPPPNMY